MDPYEFVCEAHRIIKRDAKLMKYPWRNESYSSGERANIESFYRM